MLRIFRRKLRHLCSRLWWLIWKRPRPKVVVKRFGRFNSKCLSKGAARGNNKSKVHTKGQRVDPVFERRLRIATFNVAMFSLAPAIPKPGNPIFFSNEKEDYPKSILKQSPLHNTITNSPLAKPKNFTKSKPKVCINLPDNEISLANRKLIGFTEDGKEGSPTIITDKRFFRSKIPVRSPICYPSSMANWQYEEDYLSSSRTILEILKEADADILALQDVKAEEEKGMNPLSDLAAALGMEYVFAESWAPEYGNAVLSKWPIKRWKVHKIANDDDFRNLLKVTIDVPRIGEITVCCTQLDHLDENWRMKQINAITQLVDSPHILAGGLNSLERFDYSSDRWMDIIKYYEQIGKPTPKAEVMRFLKGRGYTDSKQFAGECVPVVIMAKGQNVQGTCKYGTRVDYILTSPDSGFKFIPGSYSVISSKGTSDHHLVKVDIVKVKRSAQENAITRQKNLKQKLVKITNSCSSTGIWQIHD